MRLESILFVRWKKKIHILMVSIAFSFENKTDSHGHTACSDIHQVTVLIMPLVIDDTSPMMAVRLY
ncbi:hypothetical protein J6590_018542 [Homalodisca vitripennis]|nr:hypothetical protein J6590_018542 [Homalodisca vitripennis]